MLQSQRPQINNLLCDFHNKNIDFACTNKECDQSRYGCFKCMQMHHNKHIKDVQEFDGIKEGIDKCLQETDAIILKIDNFVKQAFQALIKMKEQLLESKEKFCKFPGELTKTEINQVLDEVVNYSQGRYQKMMEKVSKYISEMKVTVDKGSSLLIETADEKEETANESVVVDQIVQFQIDINIQSKINELDNLIGNNQRNEALELINEILNLNPDNRRIQIAKAKLLYQTDQKKKGAEVYEKMLEKDPQDWEVKRNLGEIYLDLCNYDKAQKLFQELQASNPKSFEFAYQHGKFLFKKGSSLYNQNQFAEAYTIFLELDDSSEFPPHPNLKLYIGDCLARMGELAQGIQYWQQAILYGHKNKDEIQNLIDKTQQSL